MLICVVNQVKMAWERNICILLLSQIIKPTTCATHKPSNTLRDCPVWESSLQSKRDVRSDWTPNFVHYSVSCTVETKKQKGNRVFFCSGEDSTQTAVTNYIEDSLSSCAVFYIFIKHWIVSVHCRKNLLGSPSPPKSISDIYFKNDC